MSKRIRDRDESLSLVDAEFAAALEDEDAQHRRSRGRRMEHKTHQLCRQVQRALNFALAAKYGGDALESVFVSDVLPASGCGHLLVYVVIPNGRSMSDVLAGLRARTPGLRTEVARSISRKRAPELSFVPGSAEGEGHE